MKLLSLRTFWVLVMSASLYTGANSQSTQNNSHHANNYHSYECIVDTANFSVPPLTANVFLPNGNLFSPRGRLHVLFILLGDSSNTIPSSYIEGRFIPARIRGDTMLFPNNSQNPIINQYPGTVSNNQHYANISEFFYTFSNPSDPFIVTGYVYPKVINVNTTNNELANERALNYIAAKNPNFPWADFDLRSTKTPYTADPNEFQPDGDIDMVVFFHKKKSGIIIAGTGLPANYTIPGTNYGVTTGYYALTAPDKFPEILDAFTHEFDHLNYQAAHSSGANSTHGYHYYVNHMYGLMSGQNLSFPGPNAWESWRRDWLSNLIDLEGDINNNSYTINLKDYALSREAIRVAIPFSDRTEFSQNHQHLWIEYHSKQNSWDRKLGYTAINMDTLAPGVYMYVTDGSVAKLDRNGNKANHIKALSASGSYDWELTGDTILSNYGHRLAVFQQGDENPLAGHSYQTGMPLDADSSGSISLRQFTGNGNSGVLDNLNIAAEKTNGINYDNWRFTGNRLQAFQPGDKAGIGGIEPIVNYPFYFDYANNLSSTIYNTGDMEPYVMNGLSVEFLGINANGEARIRVRFDDSEIDRDMRWSGQVKLPSLAGYKSNDEYRLAADKTLLVNQSKTPYHQKRDSVSGLFAPPSVLTMEQGSQLVLEPRSKMILDEHATLLMEEGSTLILEDEARLEVKNASTLKLQDNARIEVRGKAQILIEGNSDLIYESGAEIVLRDADSHLEIDGKLWIAPQATFTFGGNGYLTIGHPNTGFNIECDTSSSFRLIGNNTNDLLLRIKNGSRIMPRNTFKHFELFGGKIELESNARIYVYGERVELESLEIESGTPGQRHLGIALVYNGGGKIRQVNLRDARTGIYAFQFNNPGVRLSMEQVNISHCLNGIIVSGGGIDFEAVSVEDNQNEGLLLDGTTLFSRISGGHFDRNYKGIEMQASGAGLYVSGITSNYNQQDGVHISGNAGLNAVCSELRSNPGAGVVLGFGASGTFDNSRQSTGAQNDFGNCGKGIQAGLASQIHLNKGRNFLITQVKNSANSVQGQLLQLGSPTLSGSENEWNDRSSPCGKVPASGTDYDLQTVNGIASINGLDPSCFPTACGVLPGSGGGMLTPLQSCINCREINSNAYLNKPLNEALADALSYVEDRDAIPSAMQDDLEAIARLSGILQESFEEMSTEESWLLRLGYQKMWEAFSMSIANGKIPLAQPGVNYPSQESFLEVVAAVDGFSANINSEVIDFAFGMDKAYAFQATAQWLPCLQLLDSLLLNAPDAAWEALIQDRKCSIQAQMDLQNDLITAPEFENARESCLGGAVAKVQAAPSVSQSLISLNQDLEVFPNPAGDRVEIKLSGELTAEEIKLRLLDLNGQQILENQGQLALDLTKVPDGIYFLHVQTKSSNSFHRIVHLNR